MVRRSVRPLHLRLIPPVLVKVIPFLIPYRGVLGGFSRGSKGFQGLIIDLVFKHGGE